MAGTRKRKIRKISKAKKELLEKHKQMYSEKHIQIMRSKLVWGYSFDESHQYALHKLKTNEIKDLDAKYVFFDFETTGCGSICTQRAIQLAWFVTNENFDILKSSSYYFSGIKEINTAFHGEKVAESVKNSKNDNKSIMSEFIKDTTDVSRNNGFLIAHNISFDLRVLQNECNRINIDYNIENITPVCTMKKSRMFCNIKKESKYRNDTFYIKNPTLCELYSKCFDEAPSIHLHEAMNDVKILYECYQFLKRKKIC